MKITRGEFRGVIALGVVLVAVLCLIAWNDYRSLDTHYYRLPDVVKSYADSVKNRVTGECDSVAEVKGRKVRDGKIALKKKKARPVVMRSSPLDDEIPQ